MRFTPFHSVLLLSLYFAEGFPAGLMVHVIPPVLREHGVPLEYIGLIKMLAFPWVLKFLWAPWVDRYNLLQLGLHRGWIITAIGVVSGLLLWLGTMHPGHLGAWGILLFMLILVCLNFGAATQDIATDGLAVKLLPPPMRGWGNALQVGGYKVGMIVSASLLLMAIDKIGWGLSLYSMAAILVCCLVPILLFDERPLGDVSQTDERHQDGRIKSPVSLALILNTYLSFLRQPGMIYWVAVLLLFKMPDSLASGMIKPMLVDKGMSLSDVGVVTLMSSLVGVAAVFAGGGFYDRFGPRVCLVSLSLLQALALAMYSIVSGGATEMPVVLAVAIFEQIVDSMANVALFAMMMHYCRKEHEGADFTLQACIQVIISGAAGVFSGFVAKMLGYDGLFIAAGGISLLVASQVLHYFRMDPDAVREWRRLKEAPAE
ncbi:MFS transporter [Hahella sp. KA22]|uniref:MFS transporter n=1 Tax=Hahella sp. KA22 TaxID=1628392 RepID=UPI000FDE8D29|nr:MFS transporter [Hahella sp. KA22]AZZ93455.1 MFS transporter [Hahella sp. KA22]QAY56830.1 MFS transporter [Hahella sp. KA22]